MSMIKRQLADGSVVEAVAPPEPTAAELLAAERAEMMCSRAQGITAIGATVWASVVTLADDAATPWALRVAIYETYEWRRNAPAMDALIYAMNLTPAEADDLFRLAVTL